MFLKMNTYCVYIFLVFLLMQQSETLRCRSGNQQMDEDIRKAMLKCKRQDSNPNKNDDSSSSEDSSDENISSDSSILDDGFFSYTKKNQTNGNKQNIRNTGNGNSNTHEKVRNDQMRPYYMQPTNYTKRINDRIKNNNNDNNNNGNNNNGNNRNQDSKRSTQNTNSRKADDDNYNKKSCVFQCFFNELNLVDRRGFPEQTGITRVMLQGVYDPTVRDFVEEFVLECFHFLQFEMIDDKCIFSQHLFKCFDDKGRERCEDWDD